MDTKHPGLPKLNLSKYPIYQIMSLNLCPICLYLLSFLGLGTIELETYYDGEQRALTIRKPGVSVREPFSIKLY